MKIRPLRKVILGMVTLSLLTFGAISATATPPDGGSGIDRSDDIGADGLKRRGDGAIDDSQPGGDRVDDSATTDRQGRGRGRGRGRGGEHADRAERSDRPERADRSERSDRPERADRTERVERTERADRPERAERADRSD